MEDAIGLNFAAFHFLYWQPQARRVVCAGMSAALGYIFLLSWGLWVGAIAFFSFFAAPTAFGALEVEHAGRFMRALFPRYYMLGLICGVITLLSGGALIAARCWPLKGGAIVLSMLFGMMVIVLWARQRLLPRMNSLREEANRARKDHDDESRGEVLVRWQRLHRLSVRLNLLVLLLGLAAGFSAANYWLMLAPRY
ncbi:MAG: DUF4149 domain-containing protein [Verrucomicrobiae bacterium]|nr:DUF4149 domain-containing protein [Verrucomicrobiae bacterium]